MRMSSWIPPEMRWLSRQVRPFLRWHIASFFCISLGSLLALLSPLILKWLIDKILPSRQIGLLFGAVALIFLCHQGRAVLSSVGAYLTIVAAQRLALNLRLTLLRHLDTLSADYQESTPVGSSMYPLKEPIDEISFLGSDLLPAIVRTAMATGLTLGTMLVLNGRMTLAILPLIPIFVATRKHFRRRLERDSDTVQHDQLAWATFLQEHLSSIIAIQLLRKERRQERTALRLLGTSIRSLVRLFRTGVWLTFYTSLTIACAMSAIVGYGGWNVLTGTLTIGSLVAFYTYLTQLFEPLSGAAEIYLRAQKTFASIRRVQAVLALVPTILNASTATKFPNSRSWTIDLADVYFAYPRDRGLLSIPRLEIRAGEIVAIVGENGAGKSTLAKLLARIYDVNSGSISVAGQDIRHIEIDSLREHVSYAPPYPILFDATLASNLRLGNVGASDAELWDVIEQVGLAAWVGSLHEGLNHRVGPGGSHLSGGQRQRVGIGRSILQRPQILILDEATSSLDASSEQQLLRNLRWVLAGTTIVVISHRLSALFCVGRVIVLEAGRVIEDGAPTAVLGNRSNCFRFFSATSDSELHKA
jgi:ABC-type bacteriocin/lantibiotic exporter with double-glycine peptidase domain